MPRRPSPPNAKRHQKRARVDAAASVQVPSENDASVRESGEPPVPQVAREGIVPPLKWHGGKFYLAKKIIGLAPPHLHYVEPFAGGLQVLLAKESWGVSEVVNDVHGDLTSFWRVLQNEETFARFRRRIEAMPFSEFEYREAAAAIAGGPGPGAAAGPPHGAESARADADPVDRAAAFFVACRQSLAGRMNAFTAITKTRLRREMNNEVSAWLTCVDGLPKVHARLRRVLILNQNALDVVRRQDGPLTWFYLDPPYLDETRTVPDVYAHEMSRDQHVELLETLGTLQGRFALSGYRSRLYDDAAQRFGWTLHEFELPNQAASGAVKRRMIECVWVGGATGPGPKAAMGKSCIRSAAVSGPAGRENA